MKKHLLFFALTATIAACNNNKPETKEETVVNNDLLFFGDSISMDGAISTEKLKEQMNGKDSVHFKLTGIIDEVCQKKGCWMNVRIGSNETMKVRFKDYSFFMPKDAAGKTVTFEGFAFTDTTSVGELKHYAEDAGKTKEDMEKITQPEINIGFEANGVIIKK